MSVFVLTPLLVLLLFYLGKNYEYANPYIGKIKNDEYSLKDTKILFFLLGLLLLAYVSGQRFAFGDTTTYIKLFNDLDMSVSECISSFSIGDEWLYKFIEVFIKQYISTDPRVFIQIVSFVTVVPQLYFLYNYSGDLKLSFYFFITMGCWEHSMNGLRQYLASSIMLLGICFILNKKWYFYIPLVFIVAQIHSSALIFIPVYFIATKQAWGRFTKITLIIGLFLLVTYPISGKFINQLFIENTEYGAKYNNSEFAYSINIFRIIAMWMPVIISYINKEQISKSNKYYNLVFNLSLLCGICTTIGLFSAVYARLNLYFETFNVVLLTWNLNILKNSQRFNWLRMASIILFLLYFLYQMIVTYNMNWYERYLFFCDGWSDASWI